MRFSTTIIGFVAATLPTILAQAPATNNNPPGVQYIAKLPTNGSVSGSVIASTPGNGTGVDFQVSISGLPSQGGTFREYGALLLINAY